jgi:hypothetical protein
MGNRERRDDRPRRPGGGCDEPGHGDGAGLDRVRRRAGGLLDAADEAIDRVLSGDSEAFIRQNRQQGGQ